MNKIMKILKMFIMSVSVIVTMLMVPSMNCEAVDYYVGTYENGEEAYLIIESIAQWNGMNTAGYNCRVKSVNPNSNKFTIIYYEITLEPAPLCIKNGIQMRFRGTKEDRYKFPVESNLTEYMYNLNRRR